MLTCQIFAKKMIEQERKGCIINISSVSSTTPLSRVFTYSVSKAGLNSVVRVRTHQDIARIEVEPNDMQTVLENHHSIVRELQDYGYKYITLDLIGYQSGSMNKVLV